MNFVEFKELSKSGHPLGIILGLVPKYSHEHEYKWLKHLGCSHSKDSPSLAELDLSKRKHRWPEIRKLHKEQFLAHATAVTRMENELIELFGLPSLEMIIESLLPGWEDPNIKSDKLEKSRITNYLKVIKDFQIETIGAAVTKQTGSHLIDLPIYQYYMLNTFSVSIDKIIEQFLSVAPDGTNIDDIMATKILPQLDDFYLSSMVSNGTKRIQTRIAIKHRKEVKDALVKMIEDGSNPFRVARYLHNNIGQGELWYWNRITRSESTLAINQAFTAQGIASSINYEKWSAAANACPICSAFDGRVWEFGQGPYPVADTHPHCLCNKVGLYLPEKNIQRPHERESPYDNPYNSDEINNINEILNEQRF